MRSGFGRGDGDFDSRVPLACPFHHLGRDVDRRHIGSPSERWTDEGPGSGNYVEQGYRLSYARQIEEHRGRTIREGLEASCMGGGVA